jgi:hypothetical protein
MTTGSIKARTVPAAGVLPIDTSLTPPAEPISALPAETKRAWCDLQQRDLRAGQPPLGEAVPRQIAAGNALCMRWFALPAFDSLSD